MIVRRSVAVLALVAGLAAASAACTEGTPQGAPTSATSNSAPSVNVSTPPDASRVLPIRDVELTARPAAWQPGVMSPEAFGINVLHYIQTMARKGGVPVPKEGLKYYVLGANETVECDKARQPSTLPGVVAKGQLDYAIMWCPVFGAMTVRPEVIKNLSPNDLPYFFMLAGAFYGHGVAQQVRVGNEELASSCYHGQIVRQEIAHKQIVKDVALRELASFYDGGVAHFSEGVINGTCKNIS